MTTIIIKRIIIVIIMIITRRRRRRRSSHRCSSGSTCMYKLRESKNDMSRGGSRGRVQGVCTPPPHPLLKKILDPPLMSQVDRLVMAQKECKRRHENVTWVIHWDLEGKCGFERNDRRDDHACPRNFGRK